MPLKRDYTLPAKRVAAFAMLHEEGLLGEHETRSGPGSMLIHTRNLRAGLAPLLERRLFGSILDVGCGDFNWMSAVNLSGIRYLGIDLVKSIIEDNQKSWMEPHIRFEVMDILRTTPPKHDLVLCRDIFTHFPAIDIATAFNNIKNSGARYFAATSFVPKKMNKKVQQQFGGSLNSLAMAGYWRPIQLTSQPFLLPPPLLSIIENQPGKTLDLWSLDELPLFDLDRISNPPVHNPLEPEDFNRLEFFQKLCALPYVQKIALYGSRARRTHRLDSDIDLMIWCDENIGRKQWLNICGIVRRAHLSIPVECLRFSETLHSIPGGYFRNPDIYRTLYERPH